MSDYERVTLKTVDLGLDLMHVPDRIGEGQWARLNNLKPRYEGGTATRPGREAFLDTGTAADVHTLLRIGDKTLLAGAGTVIYRNDVSLATGFSGAPLTLAKVKPDISSTAPVWAYIGDSLQMRKATEQGDDAKWGIEGPKEYAVAEAIETGNLVSNVTGAIVYDWRYTYYSSLTGAESNPSPTFNGIAVVSQKGRVYVQASTDPQVDTIRIYRRGGTLPSGWALVGGRENSTGFFIDNNADSTIVFATQVAEDNDVPFTSVDSAGHVLYGVPLPYVWGPFLGKYILAAGDPNRPGYLYWTNAAKPDSASPINNLSVTSSLEPLLTGFIYNGQPFVWTRDNLYIIDYGGPQANPTFTTRKTPVGKGICAPFAYALGPAIWFVSQDGIYMGDGNTPAQNISDENLRPIFNGLTTEGIGPIDFEESNSIRLAYANNELHLFYKDTSGVLTHLVLSILYKRWRQESTTGWNELITYGDENQNATRVLVGASNGKVYEVAGTDDDGTAIAWNARTGSMDLGNPQGYKELGNLILDANAGSAGNITVTPYLNVENSSLTPFVFTGTVDLREKFPNTLADTYVYSVGFDFTGTGPQSLYQFDIYFRQDKEAIKHWEFPESGNALSGWQHIRDMYIALRSTAAVTLTVTIDGVVYTIADQLPSTSGERRKQHVWLPPVKGKVFRYALDSSEPFRVYGEDCEVRVKPWNTALGYTLISPWRGDGAGAVSKGASQT